MEAARRFGWHRFQPKPRFFSQPPLPLSAEFTVVDPAQGAEGEHASWNVLQQQSEDVKTGWGEHVPSRSEAFTWPEGQFEEPRLKLQRRLAGVVDVHPEFLIDAPALPAPRS